MGRRRFDHLVVELSLATGHMIPRYDLWLDLHENGRNPEHLTRRAVLEFCEGPLAAFLAARGLLLAPRAARRLRRAVDRFDPSLPTPDEHLVEI